MNELKGHRRPALLAASENEACAGVSNWARAQSKFPALFVKLILGGGLLAHAQGLDYTLFL